MKTETVELIYWLIAGTIAFIVWFTKRVESAEKAHKRGQEEGQKMLAEGVSTASIEVFLRWRRDTGFYGAFEAGIESVTKGEKK